MNWLLDSELYIKGLKWHEICAVHLNQEDGYWYYVILQA